MVGFKMLREGNTAAYALLCIVIGFLKVSLNIGVGKLVCFDTYLRRLFLCWYLRHLSHGLNVSVIYNADLVVLGAFRNNR